MAMVNPQKSSLREKLSPLFHSNFQSAGLDCGIFRSKKSKQLVTQQRWAPMGRDEPIPLPLDRKNISQSSFKPADPNLNSLLLGRLPLEIRLQIYGYILGNRRIVHLSHGRNATAFINLKWTFKKVDLALLRTCRQIYIEAVDVVYGSNIIDLEHSRILIDVSDKYLLPQRLAAIRSLRIQEMHYSFPTGSSTLFSQSSWTQFWSIIACRMNLAELSLFIFIRGEIKDITIDGPWVKPMLAVKGIQVLNLDIEPTASHSRASDQRLNLLVETLRNHFMAAR